VFSSRRSFFGRALLLPGNWALGVVLGLGGCVIGDELRARTRQFALDVIDLCLKLGRDHFSRLVRPQLLRAATGVAANHRAAGRSRSPKEFVAKLGVVIEEADESELWLDFLDTRSQGPPEAVKQLRQESTELRAIFVASRRTAAKRLERRRRDR
jgi:four helix bundle protein